MTEPPLPPCRAVPMIERRFGAAMVFMLLMAACHSKSLPLPRSGNVYVVDGSGSSATLISRPNALVFVTRSNVCDRRKWTLAETGSAQDIDAYLVRSDTTGQFTVPARIYKEVCDRVTLIPYAFVPGYESEFGAAVKTSPFVPAWLRSLTTHLEDWDVVLTRRPVTDQNLRLALQDFKFVYSMTSLTAVMREQVVHEMQPEFAAYRTLKNWPALCAEASLCDLASSVVDPAAPQQTPRVTPTR